MCVLHEAKPPLLCAEGARGWRDFNFNMQIKVLKDHVGWFEKVSHSCMNIVQYLTVALGVDEKAKWACCSFSLIADHRIWPCSFQPFQPEMLLPLSFTGPKAMWCVTPLWLSTDEEIASLISRSSFHNGWQVTAWWQLNKPVCRMEHKPPRRHGQRPALSWVYRGYKKHSRWILLRYS